MIHLQNCTLILRDRLMERASVVVEGGRIRFTGRREQAPGGAGQVIDLEGLLLGPGLMDVHCHGGGTHDAFKEPTAFMEYHLRGGTTSILPTLGYPVMKPGTIAPGLKRFLAESRTARWNTFAGFHLEGPYMNSKYGAGSAESPMRNPDPAEYEAIIREFGDRIKLWSFAPELDGANAFIRAAVEAGIRLSAGHTEATAARFIETVAMGVSQACHALNATGLMPPQRGRGIRQPGLDEAVMATDEVFAELIPDRDGVHVHPLFLKIMLKAKGADRILLITDCTTDQGKETKSDGADVHYNSQDQLSGSRLRMIEALRNMRAHTGSPLPDLFRMAALNPARQLGLAHDRGSVEIGKRADLVIMDNDLNLRRVLLAGEEFPIG